jgi:membrane associated rhomboid family serine protease
MGWSAPMRRQGYRERNQVYFDRKELYAMNGQYSDYRVSFGPPRLTPGVKYLLIVNVVAYVFELLPFIGPWLVKWGELIPVLAFGRGEVWRFVTYMFLHDPNPMDPWHILFNMLGLWMFGVVIEQMWGTRRFVVFYLFTGISAGMLSFVMWQGEIIGASGAIFGLLTVFAFYFPTERILLFFIIPMTARMAVIIFGLISLVFAIFFAFAGGGGVAHLTHLAGILTALAYVKGYPLAEAFVRRRRAALDVRQRQRETARKADEMHYFDEVIDPILKKISTQGMESLTPEEHRTLKTASRLQRERAAQSKVVPIDLFRHNRRD